MILLWLFACGPIDDETITLKGDVQPIFDRRCQDGCHDSEDPTTFNLTEGYSYDDLVHAPSTQAPLYDRIEPYSSENSYLVHKLLGTHRDLGGMGDTMPKRGTITSEEIELIRAWAGTGATP